MKEDLPMLRSLLVVLISLAVAGSVGAQTATLSDRESAAKRTPATPVIVGMMGDVLHLSIEELSQQSDLVVEANLTRLRTYINAADTAVITDFGILPIRVLQGTVSTASSAPGFANPLILSSYGGEVVRNGVTIRAEHHNMQALKDGGHYLLFLKKFGKERGVYQVYNSAAFELTADAMRILATNAGDAYQEFLVTPYSQVMARVAEASKIK